MLSVKPWYIKIRPSSLIEYFNREAMRIIIGVFLIFASISLSGNAQNNPDERGYLVSVGEMAPDFEMTLIDGTVQKLSDLQGKIVMLQFTASWCSVCRKEMPHIEEEIWQQYKDKNVVVIGVDRDEPPKKVKHFVEEMAVTYHMALDPNANIFGLFADKQSGVTRNVLIDASGKIVFLTRLYNNDEFNELVAKIGVLVNK